MRIYYSFCNQDSLKKSYGEHQEQNRKASEEKCKKLLEECFSQVDVNIKAGLYAVQDGYKKYRTDKDAAVKKFRSKSGKGPMAGTVLHDYLQGRQSEEEAIINADKVSQ